MKELLFSFPRLMTNEHDKMAKERLSSVGEIRVEATRAIFLRKEQRNHGDQVFDAGNFQQANKKDAKFAPTNSTTRMGKATGAAAKFSGFGTYDIYTGNETGTQKLAEVVLKYRMRHVLQSWGFLKDEHAAAAAAAAASKKRVVAGAGAAAGAPAKRSKNGGALE